MGEPGAVDEVGAEAVGAEGAGQEQAVVEGVLAGLVPADRLVRCPRRTSIIWPQPAAKPRKGSVRIIAIGR